MQSERLPIKGAKTTLGPRFPKHRLNTIWGGILLELNFTKFFGIIKFSGKKFWEGSYGYNIVYYYYCYYY